MKFNSVQDVARWRLCVGCGVCAGACPNKAITLTDVASEGIRPHVRPEACRMCGDCLKVCPGYMVVHDYLDSGMLVIKELMAGWGPILEIWEGCAIDAELRYHGSSGGVTSALALFCLEKMGFDSVLHTGINPDNPLRNETKISRCRLDLVATTGSRYSPASPCDGIGRVETSNGKTAFVGKPCDVQGLRKLQSVKPWVAERFGAAIGVFCAGTPSSMGTMELLRQMNIDPGYVGSVRYRGRGWPGNFSVYKDREQITLGEMSYMDAWGFLQKYRPFRCYLCPDGTSESADVSCGDPWYRDFDDGGVGYTLVLIRTEKGREIVHGAIDAGYVALHRTGQQALVKSQKNLLEKRKAVWGRLLAMRILGVPTPTYDGFPLFKNWLGLPMSEKSRSVLGTVRRVIQRGYRKPEKVQ